MVHANFPKATTLENKESTDTLSSEKVAPTKPETTRLSGNVNAELAAFLNEHRFDVRKDKGEFLEYALTEYAKSVGYSPKV